MVARALLARGSTASSALPEACSSALAALQATGPLPPPPPAAELGRRPFTCSSITALFGGQQQSEEYHEHRHHHEQQHQRYPQRQRRSGPASDTPLGRLSACRTVEVSGLGFLGNYGGNAEGGGPKGCGLEMQVPCAIIICKSKRMQTCLLCHERSPGCRTCGPGGRGLGRRSGRRSWLHWCGLCS